MKLEIGQRWMYRDLPTLQIIVEILEPHSNSAKVKIYSLLYNEDSLIKKYYERTYAIGTIATYTITGVNDCWYLLHNQDQIKE
jgi:hypothetical protein